MQTAKLSSAASVFGLRVGGVQTLGPLGETTLGSGWDGRPCRFPRVAGWRLLRSSDVLRRIDYWSHWVRHVVGERQWWVSIPRNEKMKVCRRKASNENFKLIPLNWNLFIQRIVTDDETWLHDYTILRPNNKLCSGSMPVLQTIWSSRCRHQLAR